MSTVQRKPHQFRTARFQRYALQHWLLIFLALYGVFVFLPFFAPIFMKIGWTSAGNTIYDVYSVMCHQMAQRSFFLFGKDVMYNADQLPLDLTGRAGPDTLLLRYFRGNESFGWKVAWSDRMVSMYGGVWLSALVYALLAHGRSIKPIKWWLAGILILPLVLDGATHMISDTMGDLLGGFRYHNEWLAVLTGHVFPASFYRGDEVGSFNSSMRLISGLLFSVGIVGLAFPYLDQAMEQIAHDITEKLHRWDHYERQRQLELERLLKRHRSSS